MATIAKWGGHKFVVSAKKIYSFSGLSIKGSCETETKVSDKQGYVVHKNGSPPEISFTIDINAQLGVKDVYSEAMSYVSEATKGKDDYFYMGNKKLFSKKMKLTSAQVTEIEMLPGRGNKWISCKVAVTMKQGSGDASSSSDGGRKRSSGAAQAGRQGSGGKTQGPTRSLFTSAGDPKPQAQQPPKPGKPIRPSLQ